MYHIGWEKEHTHEWCQEPVWDWTAGSWQIWFLDGEEVATLVTKIPNRITNIIKYKYHEATIFIIKLADD